MKLLKIMSALVILGTLISGCAQQAVPTMSAADVQSTAVSVAGTIVAQTQAAIPTATSLPPTDTPTVTPLPTDTPAVTNTPLVSPTTAPPTSDPNVDPCSNRVLAGSPQGRNTVIRIVNTTRYPVTVSLYLNETASHGECGYRAYNLSRNADTVISDLVQGCYNLWAWSTDSRSPFNVASGTSCINNTDKWTFEITENTIKFVGP